MARFSAPQAWTARNVAMVRASEADAAFIRLLPLYDADDLRLLPLGSTELVVALPAAHPLARRRAVRPVDLRDVKLVSWPREQAPGYFDHVRSAIWGDDPPPVTASEPDPEHLLAAVAAGAVCVLDAERAARLRPRGVVVRRFARPPPTADFGLVWSPHRVSQLLEAFIAIRLASQVVGDRYSRWPGEAGEDVGATHFGVGDGPLLFSDPYQYLALAISGAPARTWGRWTTSSNRSP